jgi:hypothetical protein
MERTVTELKALLTRFITLTLIFAATIALALAITAQFANAAVWETTQSWSPSWERSYRDWVSSSWDKHYFARPGTYQNITMDCADTVYAMRFVFAAKHGLPFAIKDPTGGRGIISNRMTRWDGQPQSVRLRNFLQYVFDITETATIPNDTYPVAVNRSALGSGSLILTDKENHHSWTVKAISRTGIPYLLFSSRPARTVLYERFEYPSIGFTFPNGISPETHAGFRAFRWPEHLQVPVWQVPGYSTEQYGFSPSTWHKQMQRRLATEQETGEQRLSRNLTDACRGARERAEMVLKADQINRQLGYQCMSQQTYDDYSTPSRDQRLKANFEAVRSAYQAAKSLSLSKAVRAQAEHVVGGGRSGSYCGIEIAPGVTLSLGQVYARSMAGRLSSNPNETIRVRWGLDSGPSGKARSCPEY